MSDKKFSSHNRSVARRSGSNNLDCWCLFAVNVSQCALPASTSDPGAGNAPLKGLRHGCSYGTFMRHSEPGFAAVITIHSEMRARAPQQFPFERSIFGSLGGPIPQRCRSKERSGRGQRDVSTMVILKNPHGLMR